MSETTLYEKVKELADELEAPKLGGQTTWQDAQRDRDKWLAKQLRVLLAEGELVDDKPWCSACSDHHRLDQGCTVAAAWFTGPEDACRFVASIAWPWERQEQRDRWAPRILTEEHIHTIETARARARLESALATIHAQIDATPDGA